VEALQAHLREARTAIAEGDRPRAVAALDVARALDPNFVAAESLRDQLRTRLEVNAPPAAVVSQAPARGIRTASPGPDSTSAVQGYAQFEQRAKQRRIQRRLTAARDAIANSQFDVAAAAVEELRELNPALPDLPALTEAIEHRPRGARRPWAIVAGIAVAATLIGATWFWPFRAPSAGEPSRPALAVADRPSIELPVDPNQTVDPSSGDALDAAARADASSPFASDASDLAAPPSSTPSEDESAPTSGVQMPTPVLPAPARVESARPPGPPETAASSMTSSTATPPAATPADRASTTTSAAPPPTSSAVAPASPPPVSNPAPVVPQPTAPATAEPASAAAETVRANLPAPAASSTSAAPPIAPSSPAASSTAAAPAAIAPSDEQLVRQALQRYRSAYQNLDAASAHAVWPYVDQAALARAFDGLASQSLTFENCDVRLGDAAATASCSGSTQYVPKVGSRVPRVEARQWSFTLRKRGAAWEIESARADR
jgi:hypothetical protein